MFIDRVYMMFERLLYCKLCIVVIIYENVCGLKVIFFIKFMVLDLGGYVCGSLFIKIGFN